MRELTMEELSIVAGGRGAGDEMKDCRKLDRLQAKADDAPEGSKKQEKAQDRLDKFMDKHPDLHCSTGEG